MINKLAAAASVLPLTVLVLAGCAAQQNNRQVPRDRQAGGRSNARGARPTEKALEADQR